VTAVPDKTFIGRHARGFADLGCHFGPESLTLAAKTIEPFVERALRLCEQEPGELGGSSRPGWTVGEPLAAWEIGTRCRERGTAAMLAL